MIDIARYISILHARFYARFVDDKTTFLWNNICECCMCSEFIHSFICALCKIGTNIHVTLFLIALLWVVTNFGVTHTYNNAKIKQHSEMFIFNAFR